MDDGPYADTYRVHEAITELAQAGIIISCDPHQCPPSDVS